MEVSGGWILTEIRSIVAIKRARAWPMFPFLFLSMARRSHQGLSTLQYSSIYALPSVRISNFCVCSMLDDALATLGFLGEAQALREAAAEEGRWGNSQLIAILDSCIRQQCCEDTFGCLTANNTQTMFAQDVGFGMWKWQAAMSGGSFGPTNSDSLGLRWVHMELILLQQKKQMKTSMTILAKPQHSSVRYLCQGCRCALL
eukprot:scaffold109094_cov43-Prasinocladus_malaysianus.AAC.1